MRIVRNTLLAILTFAALVLAHYTLPQHDVVRVVNTYQERQDFDDWTRIFWSKPDDLSEVLMNRDVQFIQTVKKKTFLFGFIQRDAEGVMVYRNEDTGWRWPPYFKFDTASLQTEADDLRSTPEAPKWAVMTHYGWRAELFSAFPNAVAIRPVAFAVHPRDVAAIPRTHHRPGARRHPRRLGTGRRRAGRAPRQALALVEKLDWGVAGGVTAPAPSWRAGHPGRRGLAPIGADAGSRRV